MLERVINLQEALLKVKLVVEGHLCFCHGSSLLGSLVLCMLIARVTTHVVLCMLIAIARVTTHVVQCMLIARVTTLLCYGCL